MDIFIIYLNTNGYMAVIGVADDLNAICKLIMNYTKNRHNHTLEFSDVLQTVTDPKNTQNDITVTKTWSFEECFENRTCRFVSIRRLQFSILTTKINSPILIESL